MKFTEPPIRGVTLSATKSAIGADDGGVILTIAELSKLKLFPLGFKLPIA